MFVLLTVNCLYKYVEGLKNNFNHLDSYCSLLENDAIMDEPNTCPVCTNLLTEPFLTDCGHYVCGKCAQLLATGGADCPVCHKFGVFSNLHLNENVQHDDNGIEVHVHYQKATKQTTREYCTHVS